MPRGLVAHPLQHVAGRVDHPACGGVGHRLQQDQVAQALEQVDGEPARIVAGVHHASTAPNSAAPSPAASASTASSISATSVTPSSASARG